MSILIKFYCDKGRHLVCLPFSVNNLHRMANTLGINRCWFHNSKTKPHYDIPKDRIDEIMSKCTVVNSKTILLIIKSNQNG